MSRIFVEADCLAIVFKGKTELERTSGLLDRFRKSVPKFCSGKIWAGKVVLFMGREKTVICRIKVASRVNWESRCQEAIEVYCSEYREEYQDLTPKLTAFSTSFTAIENEKKRPFCSGRTVFFTPNSSNILSNRNI